MNPLLLEPFPSSIGPRRKPPLPSLLCTHAWLLQVSFGSITDAHMDKQKVWRPHELCQILCNVLDPSPSKEQTSCGCSSDWQVGAFISCRTESQNTIACCFLLALMLGSCPAGSEVYFNGVCSLSLAISAMYQSCKFRSEGRGAFLLLPENTSCHPSLSWECPSTFIHVSSFIVPPSLHSVAQPLASTVSVTITQTSYSSTLMLHSLIASPHRWGHHHSHSTLPQVKQQKWALGGSILPLTLSDPWPPMCQGASFSQGWAVTLV